MRSPWAVHIEHEETDVTNATDAGGTPSSSGKPEDLVAEIEQVREHLASSVDSLVERVSPKNVAGRAISDLKSKFVDPDGKPRLETIGPVVGGVLVFAGVVVAIRKIVRD